MRQRQLASIFAVLLLLLALAPSMSFAAPAADKDTDVRMVDAKVTEVADGHISVMARTGVEHVIQVDRTGTKVLRDGRVVSLKDVREGDVITIELDAQKPVKFAMNISMRSENSEVARNRR
jgi:hypothetical protein